MQSIDELGHNFFKLEAYFVTHFLYVVSEWGKHSLQTELFWEEINFIVRNMKHVRTVLHTSNAPVYSRCHGTCGRVRWIGCGVWCDDAAWLALPFWFFLR